MFIRRRKENVLLTSPFDSSCDLKLQRFEYENKRSETMNENEDPDIRTVSSLSHSGEDKSDRRYINVFDNYPILLLGFRFFTLS